MSKEITKTNILQEMQDKLGMREFEPGRFIFSETVHPVYEIRSHVEKWVSTHLQVSITAGPAPYVCFTVPSDERWAIRAYNIVFMAAGAYKVTGLYTVRKDGSNIYLDMKEGQTVSYAVNLPQFVVLNPGDKLYVYIDDYTSTANIRVYIDYRVEMIR